MNATKNSIDQKSDNKLLITIVILVVLIFFILPIVCIGLMTFGVFNFVDKHVGEVIDIAKDEAIRLDENGNSMKTKFNGWVAIYDLAIAADLPEGSRPMISSITCDMVDDTADGLVKGYTKVCSGDKVSVKVERNEDDKLKAFTFGSGLVCTRLELDPVKEKAISAIQYSIESGTSCGVTEIELTASSDDDEYLEYDYEDDDSSVEIDVPGVHVNLD